MLKDYFIVSKMLKAEYQAFQLGGFFLLTDIVYIWGMGEQQDSYIPTEEDLKDFGYICHEVENGEALRNACKAFMNAKKFYQILDYSDDLRKQYARACELRQESIFEDILQISDESNADISIGDGMIPIVNGEAVQRSRLKIDARKWMLSKMAPKKYGDKLDVTTDGEKINSDVIDYTKLSDAVLEEISKAQSE